MRQIGDIDPRLKVESAIQQEGLVWRNARDACFSLFGLITDEKGYKRMDSAVAEAANPGLFSLHRNTAGGRLVFETDSPFVAISVKTDSPTNFPHMPATGVCGFDLYQDRGQGFEYWRTFVPPHHFTGAYESLVDLPTDGPRKIMIHFPLYNNVDELYIGLLEGATVKPYNPYRDCPPFLYYGSSITQGACASRPGCHFLSLVSHKTGIDHVCLGFSGSAHGEQVMAEYIAAQPMSVFVMDYEHNDILTDDLIERHPAFYETVRKANPELPIIIMSAPHSAYDQGYLDKSGQVVYKTYAEAKARGDKVAFIDGRTMFGEFREFATVDHSHPNDYGFNCMAKAVLEALKEFQL